MIRRAGSRLFVALIVLGVLISRRILSSVGRQVISLFGTCEGLWEPDLVSGIQKFGYFWMCALTLGRYLGTGGSVRDDIAGVA